MKEKKYYILTFLAIFVVAFGAWAGLHLSSKNDPPIEKTVINDPGDYGKVNRYVKRLLKTDYAHILPEKLPENCSPEYEYSYQCDFDGRLYLSIYLELRFDSEEEYLAELERIEKNAAGAERKHSQERQYDIFDLSGIENCFDDSETFNTGYSAAFTEADASEMTVRYLILKQYRNENKLSDPVNEMLGKLKSLREE